MEPSTLRDPVTDPNPFLIGDPLTPNPQINGLLGMLRYARWTTLKTVQPLTVEQLDHLQDSKANSIGHPLNNPSGTVR